MVIKLGAEQAESGQDMMADEEEEVKQILQKLQVGPLMEISV